MPISIWTRADSSSPFVYFQSNTIRLPRDNGRFFSLQYTELKWDLDAKLRPSRHMHQNVNKALNYLMKLREKNLNLIRLLDSSLRETNNLLEYMPDTKLEFRASRNFRLNFMLWSIYVKLIWHVLFFVGLIRGRKM